MGTVYARGTKLWIGVKDESGKWNYQPTGLSVGDERKAQKLVDQLEAKVERGQRLAFGADGDPLTLGRYAARWIGDRKKLGIRDARNEATRLNKHVLPTLGALRLDEVRIRHVKELVQRLRTDSKLSPRSVHHVYGTLHKLFEDAIVEELLESSPCHLKREHLGKKKDKDPEWRAGALFTREEVEALISDARIPELRRVVYALMALGGLRHGEVAGLKWRHLDAAAEPLGRLLVAHSYEEDTKTEIPRAVPLHPVLAAILAEWKLGGWPVLCCRHAKPDDLVAPNEAGRMRQQSKTWESWKLDLEKLVFRHRRMHDLRRTFITLARVDGARKDLLEMVTHAPRGDIMNVYSSMPWSSLCDEVAKLRISRVEGRVVALPVVKQ